MCLVTDQRKPLIAKKNITVYKSMYHSLNTFISEFNTFYYELNKLYETLIIENKGFNCYDSRAIYDVRSKYPDFRCGSDFLVNKKVLKSFGPGFHSAVEGRLHTSTSKIIVECVIPKGSEYYQDISKTLYVSNKIIIKQIVYSKT